MRKYLALCLLTACYKWSPTNTVLEAGFVAANAEDWYQTTHVTGDCNETNPIIGKCGSTIQPNTYFPVTFVLHAVISAVLPPTARLAWQGLTTGMEVTTVWRNTKDGYGLWP